MAATCSIQIGYELLLYAVRTEAKKMAELLLSLGADVNVKNRRAETPLSLAREEGHIEIFELLRKHGAKD